MSIETKVISTSLLLAGMVSWAAAQAGYTPATTTTTTSTYSTPTSAGPVAPRTGEYPGAINGAMDNTVDDYTKRGTLINGKQYFAAWGGPALVNGAYSFQAIGFDWFGAVNTAVGPGNGTWRTGIATSRWAGGLLINFNKTTTKTALAETKSVISGDGFGLFGDFNLGSSDVYGEISLLTAPGNYSKITLVGPPEATTENTPTTTHIMAGWKKDATTEGTHSLNVEASLNLISVKNAPPAPIASATDKQTEISVMFSHGYLLKAGTGYSVCLGSNSTFIYSKDDQPGTTADPDHTGLSVAPHLAFQKDLGHNFEFSSGASARLSYDMYSNTAIVLPGPATQEATRLLTSSADVNLGLRWVKDNFAIQGSLNEALLQGGPNFISGAVNPLFAQVGVSLGI